MDGGGEEGQGEDGVHGCETRFREIRTRVYSQTGSLLVRLKSEEACIGVDRCAKGFILLIYVDISLQSDREYRDGGEE